MRNPFALELILLHAPSVFDPRERAMLQGPVADVIPSTDEFEMYPVGLTSLAAYLERNSYNVRIVKQLSMVQLGRGGKESALRPEKAANQRTEECRP